MLGLMPIVFYVFAGLTVAGGTFGTIKSHEPWSVIGSLIFGVGAVAGGITMRRVPRTGLRVGIVDVALFVAFFMYEFAKSGKPMPAMPSILMGAIVILLAAKAYTELSKAQS